MRTILDPLIDIVDGLLGWIGIGLGQWAETYCKIESAEDTYNLVARDGSLVSIIRMHGITYLVGPEEFTRVHREITTCLRPALSRTGHGVQMFFKHDNEKVTDLLSNILAPSRETAERLGLNLQDL